MVDPTLPGLVLQAPTRAVNARTAVPRPCQNAATQHAKVHRILTTNTVSVAHRYYQTALVSTAVLQPQGHALLMIASALTSLAAPTLCVLVALNLVVRANLAALLLSNATTLNVKATTTRGISPLHSVLLALTWAVNAHPSVQWAPAPQMDAMASIT
jgi:hypothetical protein